MVSLEVVEVVLEAEVPEEVGDALNMKQIKKGLYAPFLFLFFMSIHLPN